MRPDNDREYLIDDNDKDCLTYSVISGLPNSRVYGRFFPIYLLGKDTPKLTGEGEKRCKEFFAYEANKAYVKDYRRTLEAFLGNPLRQPTDIISDSRKEGALKSLFHQAISLVEGKDTLDPDTLKVATEIFKKIGLLKDDEKKEEEPRIYLPARCSQCGYKIFIDEQVKAGRIKRKKQ